MQRFPPSVSQGVEPPTFPVVLETKGVGFAGGRSVASACIGPAITAETISTTGIAHNTRPADSRRKGRTIKLISA